MCDMEHMEGKGFDCYWTMFLISREFKQIIFVLSSLKSYENLWFSDDFRGYGSSLAKVYLILEEKFGNNPLILSARKRGSWFSQNFSEEWDRGCRYRKLKLEPWVDQSMCLSVCVFLLDVYFTQLFLWSLVVDWFLQNFMW